MELTRDLYLSNKKFDAIILSNVLRAYWQAVQGSDHGQGPGRKFLFN